MLLSEDFPKKKSKSKSIHSGCAFQDGACNSKFNNNGETWGVVDLSFGGVEEAAKTLAHELGHMVCIKATIERVPDLIWAPDSDVSKE